MIDKITIKPKTSRLPKPLHVREDLERQKSGAPNPIIYLDIDGVLVTPHLEPNSAAVSNLNRLLYLTGAGIVVTSTRRLSGDVASLLKGWGVQGSVLGTTPELNEQRPSGIAVAASREAEIVAHLRENEERPFVVLDDEHNLGQLAFHHVRVDASIGLSNIDVARAYYLLVQSERNGR